MLTTFGTFSNKKVSRMMTPLVHRKKIAQVKSLYLIYFFSTVFLLFFFHPYYVLFFSTLISIFIKPDKFLIPLSFSLAIASFLASRNYAVSWSSGGDDLTHWLIVFNGYQYDGIFDLLAKSFSLISLKNNEPVFYSFTLALSFLNNSEYIYVFVNYFLIAVLLFIASLITSRRHYLLIFFLFLFGVGSFAESPLLHLWRQTYASIIIYIAIVGFWKPNFKIWFLLIIGIFTHLASLIVFAFRSYLFLFFEKLKINNLFLILFLSLSIILFVLFLVNILIFSLGVNLVETYFDRDLGAGRGYVVITALVLIYYMLYRRSIQKKEIFIISLTLVISWLPLLLPESGQFAVRMSQFLVLFHNFIFFMIIIRLPRKILFFTLPVIFSVQFYKQSENEMINTMFNDYAGIYQGIFFAVVR